MIDFIYYDTFYLLFFIVLIYFINKNSKNYEKYFSKQMLEKIIIGQNKKKLNFIFLILSLIFLILSIARPVIISKPIQISQNTASIIVGIDISASMKSDDIYPSRLDFSKSKFNDLLLNLKDEKVGVIGFSSRSFLVAPITNDYATLKYLIENLNQDVVSIKGSSVLDALKSTNTLLKDSKNKALLLFTDGTDENNFQESIDFAKKNTIKVFVYAIATKKGGVIKDKNGNILKDSNGNLVITRLNENISNLALKTDGAYLRYSSSSHDIKKFISTIRSSFKLKKDEIVTINNNQELYYFPLTLSLIFFILTLISFNVRNTI